MGGRGCEGVKIHKLLYHTRGNIDCWCGGPSPAAPQTGQHSGPVHHPAHNHQHEGGQLQYSGHQAEAGCGHEDSCPQDVSGLRAEDGQQEEDDPSDWHGRRDMSGQQDGGDHWDDDGLQDVCGGL
jgi:hypothetical protein